MRNQISHTIFSRLSISTTFSALFTLVAIASGVQADPSIESASIKAPFILAATDGMERRQDRREDHRDDRGDRRDTRQDCRQDEGVAGKDKRDCKQDGRDDRRDDNDED